MRDVSRVDLSTTVLGVKSSLPVYATPVASMGLGQELVSVTLLIPLLCSSSLQNGNLNEATPAGNEEA